MRHHRQRRAQGGSLLSLEVPLAGAREPVGDTLTEDEGLDAWQGQQRNHHDIFHVRKAVRSALARLPEADRNFCCALADHSVTALAAEGFGSRSSLYRRLADLRHVLTAYGIGPSWDDFAAA
jgi:RNA polymerase sigma-70 factor (ECF subfamily)